ncbi:ABC transporter permease [Mesorhizobium sp. A623]
MTAPVNGNPFPRGRSFSLAVVLLAPCVLLYIIFFAWPQVALLMLGFQGTDGSFTLSLYTKFLTDPYYLRLLWRTLLMGIATTAITIVFGVPLAYLLARSRSKWAVLILIMTTFPLLVSAVVRSFGWMVLLYRNGFVSDLMQWLYLTDGPTQLMYTLPGTIIALAQVLLPIMVLSLYAVFRSIPRDLELAAMSLGASPSVALWLVTMRLAKGGLFSGSLLVFSMAISSFATPSLVGGPRAAVMATSIYELTMTVLDWNFAAVQATILLISVLILATIYGRIINGGPPLK